VTGQDCSTCETNSGLYLLSCPDCCRRLIRSTPERSAQRQAMVEHVRRSIGEDAFDRLAEYARSQPKPRSRAP
jgi:hypothetical protein